MPDITKSLDRRIHKTNSQSDDYCIVIPHNPGQTGLGLGLGSALTSIILEYSSTHMFGSPKIDTPQGYMADDRPQMIIANFSNYNNSITPLDDKSSSSDGYDGCDGYECYKGRCVRRYINSQLIARKTVFWNTCLLIQNDLFISLLTPRQLSSDINNSLFAYLPEEIIRIIIIHLTQIGLFNTSGIDYTEGDVCLPISNI
jgi:hypothetical protein